MAAHVTLTPVRCSLFPTRGTSIRTSSTTVSEAQSKALFSRSFGYSFRLRELCNARRFLGAPTLASSTCNTCCESEMQGTAQKKNN